jgi:hypothetical protein
MEGLLELINRLKHMRQHISAPLLVVSLLISLGFDLATARLLDCRHGIARIKYQTRFDESPSMPSTFSRNDLETISTNTDFVAASRDLTRLSAKLAQCKQHCKVLKPMVLSIDVSGEEHILSATPERKQRITRDVEVLKNLNLYTIRLIYANAAEAEFLSLRAQAYVQTVYYLLEPPNPKIKRSNRMLDLLPNRPQRKRNKPRNNPRLPKNSGTKSTRQHSNEKHRNSNIKR